MNNYIEDQNIMHQRQIGFSIRYAIFKYVVRIVIVIFIVRKQPFNCMKIKQLLFLEVLLAHVGLFQCLLLHCLFLSSLYAFPCVSPHIPLCLLYPAIGHFYPPQFCFRFLPVFFFLFNHHHHNQVLLIPQGNVQFLSKVFKVSTFKCSPLK